MSLYKELNSNKDVKDICGVQFSISSPEEILKRSVVEVTQTILYESNGDPVIGGLFDPRMGVIDHGKICPTDNLDNRFCPGRRKYATRSQREIQIARRSRIALLRSGASSSACLDSVGLRSRLP